MKIYKIANKEIAKVLPLNRLRQPDNSTCGHTSIAMIAQYYNINKSVKDIQNIASEKENKEGLDPNSIINIFNKLGLSATKHFNLSFEEIKNYINKNTPIIIELQAWSDNKHTNNQWKNEWNEGHYIVTIGYTQNKLIFADPSTNERTYLSYEELLPRWHDNDYGTKNEKLAIIINRNKNENI